MAIHPNKALLATGGWLPMYLIFFAKLKLYKIENKGYQQVCIYDVNANNQSTALLSVEGTVKNTVAIGFQDKGLWMYTAGEDRTIKIWDMRFDLFFKTTILSKFH